MLWTSACRSSLHIEQKKKESIHSKCQHAQFWKKKQQQQQNISPAAIKNNDTFHTNFLVNPDWKYYQNFTWKNATLHHPVMNKPPNCFEGLDNSDFTFFVFERT